MPTKNSATIKADVAANLPDNTSEQISPADIRGVFHDVVDSYAASGTALPNPATGPEFFRLEGHATLPDSLYVLLNGAYEKAGGSVDESTIGTRKPDSATSAARTGIPPAELSFGDSTAQTNLGGLVFYYTGDGTTNTAANWEPEQILLKRATDAQMVAMTATGEMPNGVALLNSTQSRWYEYDAGTANGGTAAGPGWFETTAPTAGASGIDISLNGVLQGSGITAIDFKDGVSISINGSAAAITHAATAVIAAAGTEAYDDTTLDSQGLPIHLLQFASTSTPTTGEIISLLRWTLTIADSGPDGTPTSNDGRVVVIESAGHAATPLVVSDSLPDGSHHVLNAHIDGTGASWALTVGRDNDLYVTSSGVLTTTLRAEDSGGNNDTTTLA